MTKHVINAFTVDVEDYFQVEAFKNNINVDNWGNLECRVEKNTDLILQLLDDKNIKGTFFVLGWIAKRYPNVVKKISEQGHEVASHGMSHQLVYKQEQEVFQRETKDSRAILQDLSQQEVIGYRAATYSITKQSLWALDILYESGFRYDSSIFPMRHDKYGIADANPEPHILKTPSDYELVEFPISTVKTKWMTLPVAGGGYFRIFPYMYTRWGLGTINSKNKPFVFYLHPWEVDPDQPKVEGVSAFSRFRHYTNLHRCYHRLEKLLDDFEFSTMETVLKNMNLLKY